MSEWRIKLYRGVYAAVRTNGGKTEREIGRALSQQAPKPSAELSPEALRALRLLLPPGAAGLGTAVTTGWVVSVIGGKY